MERSQCCRPHLQGHFTLGLIGDGVPGATDIKIVGSRGSITIDTSNSAMRAHVDGKVRAVHMGIKDAKGRLLCKRPPRWCQRAAAAFWCRGAMVSAITNRCHARPLGCRSGVVTPLLTVSATGNRVGQGRC